MAFPKTDTLLNSFAMRSRTTTGKHTGGHQKVRNLHSAMLPAMSSAPGWLMQLPYLEKIYMESYVSHPENSPMAGTTPQALPLGSHPPHGIWAWTSRPSTPDGSRRWPAATPCWPQRCRSILRSTWWLQLGLVLGLQPWELHLVSMWDPNFDHSSHISSVGLFLWISRDGTHAAAEN